jgi:hypothetical protein
MRAVLRIATIFAAGTAVLGTHDIAGAGIGRECRKTCKPAIARCVSDTGQRRRVCRKLLIPACKKAGLEVCSLTMTTTTTVPAGGAGPTTTTTLPRPPGSIGMSMDAIQRDASTDPGVFRFLVWLKGYGDIVPVDLDPSHFYVVDAAGNRYGAEPASGPDDCTDQLTTVSGTAVTCWVTFVMPLSTAVAPEGGRSGAAVGFSAGGYGREVHFTFYPNGGHGIGI